MRLVRLDRDEALLAEQLGRPALQPRHVMAHRVEMAVEPVEPVFQPAQARFEERDAQVGMPLEHAAGHDVEHRRHLLEGVADHVAEEQVVVAAGGEARHQRAEAAMDGGEQAVVGDGLPERSSASS